MTNPRPEFSAAESCPARPMRVSRRGFLAGVGVVTAAGAVQACQATDGSSVVPRAVGETMPAPWAFIPFDGEHQAGIATPHQSHGAFVAFDLIPDGGSAAAREPQGESGDTEGRPGRAVEEARRDLTRLMRVWTEDARSLTSGRPALADLEPELANQPANLTITLGMSPRLLHDVRLADRAPAWVRKHIDGLPAFSTDKLDPAFTGGDLLLQICGDNVTAVSHAMRVMTRSGREYTRVRWTQRGFVDSPSGQTPRNLLGFKDGTVIPRSAEEFDKSVWDDQGGSAVVVRRVRFDMPNWEALDRGSREIVFGRHIDTGAPLTGNDEFDAPDLNKLTPAGLPVIDPNSHVGITAGSGPTMLRRPFNYDGAASRDGDSGLIFVCFQNDPDKAFIPLQKRLAAGDRLNQWTEHVGSALFWCPPGTRDGEHWAQRLLS